MKKVLKIFFYSIVSAMMITAVAAVIIIMTFDINKYKHLVEKSVSDAISMDVRITGRMKLSLTPRITVVIPGIRIKNKKEEVGSVGRVRIKVMLVPLLSRKIHISLLEIKDAFIHLNKKMLPKKPSINQPASSADLDIQMFKVSSLVIDKISLENSDIHFDDGTKKTRIKNLNFAAGDFVIIEDFILTSDDLSEFFYKGFIEYYIMAESVHTNTFKMRQIKVDMISRRGVFKGELKADNVSANKVGADNVNTLFTFKNKTLELHLCEMFFFGAKSKIFSTIDMANKTPSIKLDFNMAGLELESMMAALGLKSRMSGPLTISGQITTMGFEKKDIIKNLCGEASIKGKQLVLKGINLDYALHRYSKTQRFDMVDVCFFVAGPFGPLISKSYDYIAAYKEIESEEESQIKELALIWHISNGVAESRDVAFSTYKNRVAVRGGINLKNGALNGFDIAWIDKNGCVIFNQVIEGTLKKPEIKKSGLIVRTIINPILAIPKKGKELILSPGCDVFYDGAVSHPEVDGDKQKIR